MNRSLELNREVIEKKREKKKKKMLFNRKIKICLLEKCLKNINWN